VYKRTLQGGNCVVDQEVGTRVAGYRIESVIGRGGMGIVYLAEDLSLQRKVALKLLPPDLSQDGKFRERFVRESRLAASLDHPNIVPIFESREADGQLYIAMRYVPGLDLKTLIQRDGALGLDRSIWILTQVASALDAAHGAGLIHRDVKPANILVATGAEAGSAEHVYLSDFGLTKRTSSDSGVTATGQFVGTLDYAAPEQFEGTGLDARTDVYSLGCVLYECLTGEVPFGRENQAGLVYAHLLAPPPKVTGKRPELPPKLDPVVAKAMAKAPDDRYLTAGAFARAARQAVPGAAAPAEGFLPRGRQLVAMIVAFALIAAGAVAAVVLTRGGPAATKTPRLAPANSVAMVDPKTNEMTGWVPVAGYPTHMIESGGSLWVSRSDQKLVRVDLKTRKVVATIRLPGVVTSLSAGELGSVWVGLGLANWIVQIDPQTNGILKKVELGGCCSGPSVVAVDGSTIWVTDAIETRRVQPGAQPVLATIPGTGTAGAVVDQSHHLWVSNGWDTISVIEPFTNTLSYTLRVPGGPASLTRGLGTDMWVATQAGEVKRISPSRRAIVGSVPVGNGPSSIATGEDAIWAANAIQGTVARIDPRDNSVVAAIPIGRRLGGVTVAGGIVWAAVQAPEATAGATGKIAFDDSGDLYVMNADGTGRKQITSGDELDRDPDWSPDGTRIAFSREERNGGSHLFIANADGTELRQVTRGEVFDFDAAWSNDGSRLAFHRASAKHMWVIKVDGTGARDITPRFEGNAGRPDWSPDSTTIVFRSDPEDVNQLFAVRPDGTGLTQLTTDPGNKDSPAWSPDGVRIAFAGDQQGPGVYLTSTGGLALLLVHAPENHQDHRAKAFPAWSPDGTKIAFGGVWDIPGDIFVINADGSGVVQLTHDGKAGIPDWQPPTGSG
jgi:protein kinase-like protein/WD40 repeat protein